MGINNPFIRAPEMAQSSNQMTGMYKGLAVDVRDPFGLGRVRVWSYPLHGDFNRIPIEAIPWAEPKHKGRGFVPPEVWDRIWIGFECGDKYTMVYTGTWYGVPVSKGSLPFNRKTGTEVRPENWHFHDLYPEVQTLASTAEGNTIWMFDKYTGTPSGGTDGNLVSGINLMDTGAKSISISSFNMQQQDYAGPFGANSEPIYVKNADIPEGNIVRDGTNDFDLDPVVGSIDIGHTNLMRSLASSDDIFTQDSMNQMDASASNGGAGIEVQAMGGVIYHERQDQTVLNMNSDSMMLVASKSVFCNNLFTLPKRFDQ